VNVRLTTDCNRWFDVESFPIEIFTQRLRAAHGFDYLTASLTEETSVKPFENIDSSDMLLRKMKMESELTILSENKLYSTALWLAIFTIVYNLIEGLVASYFGYHDETLALFGFGVDSFIEMISGIGIAHMIYRMRAHPDTKRDDFERTALRVTGTSFYLLAGGLIISAAVIILTGRNPETTLWGVVISVISIVVMLCLIYGKIRVGKALRSQPILADASCTKVCILCRSFSWYQAAFTS
jgi:hypothetical protein